MTFRSWSNITLACACLGAFSLPAAAQTLKPGLWDVTSKVSSADGQAQAAMSMVQEHLANMAPEQRQALQQAMDKHGVQINMSAGGALNTRICMTREMIARREMPVQKGECTQKTTPLSATRMTVAFTCTKPPASGKGEIVIDSDTSYHAHMTFKSDQLTQGKEMITDSKATWAGADCGNLRPLSMPEK
jgi:hypothetical protein